MVNKNSDYALYLVTNRYDYSDEQFLNIVFEACDSGVTLVQLREKDVTTKRYFDLAVAVKKITDKFNIPLIIDDRVDICLAVNAAGVHIGDNELPIKIVRQLIGKDKILGVSVKDVQHAKEAEAQGADYFGVGAIYPTKTKVITKHTTIATLKDIVDNVAIPVNAIGGIKENNILSLKNTGISGVCMVSELMQAEDVRTKVANCLKTVAQLR
ncbi:thiamine phosphate synthase [uncultured Leuconostoc sp.]|uniref:thiamine phosphate synthase n=1 Tax=uncultured Leuconostoc sp. TaxID=173262 RepID=UPI0025F16C72|nr:thiamine phosphate synthase [uncultured Leuconostoc sp.]